jgi:phosphatidylserine/phosphatidylglycerophosphate/cardiolipin synthase-like enzyme
MPDPISVGLLLLVQVTLAVHVVLRPHRDPAAARAQGTDRSLRNHRKIVVIDDRITDCGSQNCADPGFLVEAKNAPWVDAMIRFEGPSARQNQILFAAGWMAHTAEDLGEVFRRPVAAAGSSPRPFVDDRSQQWRRSSAVTRWGTVDLEGAVFESGSA